MTGIRVVPREAIGQGDDLGSWFHNDNLGAGLAYGLEFRDQVAAGSPFDWASTRSGHG